MESSSEDERSRGYQPVLAEQIKNSPRVNSSSNRWPKDGVNLYSNDLFTDGDVLGGPNAGPGSSNGLVVATSPRPGTASRMQQQKSSLAARRQERMQANVYERNETMTSRAGNPTSPTGQSMQLTQQISISRFAAPPVPEPTSSPRGDNNVYGLRSSYDPNEENGDQDFTPRTYAAPRQQQQREQQREREQPTPAPSRQLDLSDIKSFLGKPAPKGGPILCYIVRDASSTKIYPKYNLFLEDGKRFLLAARKRKKQTTSNYVISLDYEDLGRDSEKFFGKLRANFVGTGFTIFDDGDKPGQRGPSGKVREELGCISYQYNVLGTRGPRKMTACIPAVDASGRSMYRPRSEGDSLLDRLKNDKALEELLVMFNKPPRWNEELNAYCLNFNGRVTEASVKNFQLVTEDNLGYVLLQFGKIGRNTFTMDYQWPMSALQAFAICLSSFDNKLACE
jgi:tubby-related protein 1